MTSTERATRWALAALLVAALAGALAWWLARGRAADVSYRTAAIERGPLQAAVSATGTVTPVTQVQVSSQVSGQIRELYVDFNSEVKKGQLIARLDPETFEYRVRQASADVEAARASVLTAQANVQHALAQASRAEVDRDEARRDLERKQGLVAQNFISPAEAETARARAATLAEAAKAAQAQVAVARASAQNAEAIVKQRLAQLEQARVDLERTQIRSPVDGIVIKRSIEVGQTVAASLQAPELFVIARNLDDMQVEAAIDEADIARVRVGQKTAFTIDAFPGRQFDGAVKQVRKAALSNQNVVTYTVVVGFANPGSAVLPGMTANVRVITETRDNVLKVPNAALRVRIAGLEPAAAASVPRGAPSAGGGAMAGLRDRLAAELELTPQQLQRIDELFAAMRPRFAELRNVDDAERAKARERIAADLRAQIGEQLTPPQQAKYRQIVAELAGRQVTRGRIHVLDGGRPIAVAVRLGVSDGAMTELVEPLPPDVREGATVVTAVLGASPASAQRPPPGPRPIF